MQELKQEGHDEWIKVGGLFVHVFRIEDGVRAEIWPTDDDDYILDNDPIRSAWADFSEAIEPKMNREQMIDWLIDNDLNDWNGNEAGKSEYLAFILHEGFVGYRNQTDDELRAEILERDPDKELEN